MSSHVPPAPGDYTPALLRQTSVSPPSEPNITLSFPSIPPLDFSRMEADEFVLPGATVIWPDPQISVSLHVTPRVKYPSTEESVAPNGHAVIGSRSEQHVSGLHHWLRLFRRGDEQARGVFNTPHAFESLWSHDSRGVAISHLLGKNSAEVLVVRVRDQAEAERLELRDALSPYFSNAQLDSPRFEKAYRWSDGALLLVRGIGRQASAQHDFFGYEVLVDTEHPTVPGGIRLVRGYTKAAGAVDRAEAR